MMIVTRKLTRIYQSGKRNVVALNEVDLSIERKQFVLIKGPSGCGKSTLLFSMAGMLVPTLGDILINETPLFGMSEKERARFRSQHIGFVFQSYYLFPYLTILENILIARSLNKQQITRERAIALAESLHLGSRLGHKPSELSVGEKQRVALARAFISDPEIILADEPTGNLDPENAGEVIGHLNDFRQKGGTVVMVSHGNEADDAADCIMHMKEGRISHVESR